MIQHLPSLFERDLNRLITEVSAYDDESIMWKVEASINNSAGNLALHICGNLQHFIGAVLGKSGYVRQREMEFSQKNIPLSTILEDIETTKSVVSKTLGLLSANDLTRNYPINVFGDEMSIEYFLLHLSTHLNYHLGQVNYHRRLLDTK